MNELMSIILNFSKDVIALLALFGIVFEITPIKINPLSYLFKKIGKAINHDINSKVDQLATKVEELDVYTKENHKKELRIQIANFASDLRHGEIKSESQFISVIELCDEYLSNKWNSKVKLDAEFIKSEYKSLGLAVQNGNLKLKEGKK